MILLFQCYSDRDRIGKRQHGGLPKRCVYLRNTASDSEVPILQFINIDEVSRSFLLMEPSQFLAVLILYMYLTTVTLHENKS